MVERKNKHQNHFLFCGSALARKHPSLGHLSQCLSHFTDLTTSLVFFNHEYISQSAFSRVTLINNQVFPKKRNNFLREQFCCFERRIHMGMAITTSIAGMRRFAPEGDCAKIVLAVVCQSCNNGQNVEYVEQPGGSSYRPRV